MQWEKLQQEGKVMAKTVKLADIAAIMNVSTVTVSKALSDQKGVSEQMREKIKKLADEMGYRQPSTIRRSQPGKSYNIGVLIAEQFLDKYDSFYWQMYQEVTTKAVSKSSFTMLEVVNMVDEIDENLPKLVKEKKVDGVIVIGRMKDNYLQKLQEEGGVPVIFLDFYDERQACDAVISNSYYGTYILTNYLFQSGHTKIAYVGTLLATESITDRYFGYAKSLMEHGQIVKENWIIRDRNIEDGMIDEEHNLKLPKEMPTAFVCNCDLTASLMIKKRRANGYRVPEDISIVGFDNYLYPGLCDIGITTYEVDIKEMARRTIHNIMKKMENGNYKPGVFSIEGHLVYKDSVAHV